ncbi:MAG: hypothetical protein ACSLFI_04320 [Solirubrobacterales bacterium]
MTALDLARLRTLAAGPVADPASLEGPAADVGRHLVRAGSEFVLARRPDVPSAADLEVATSTLSDSALVALGLSIGLAWPDRDQNPYPGHPFTLVDLTEAARAMHISEAASRHIVGAVRNILAQAGLIRIEGEMVRLGPIIAGWSDADLEALRRNLDVLPAAAEALQ